MVAAEPEGLAAPLTVEALTAGTVKVNINGTLSTGMKYSVNGGAKTTITETTDIAVSAGDKVRFYGNGTATQVYGDSPEVKILGDGDGFTCKAYGNIMSLLDEENFATKTDLPNQKFVFYGLFYGNTALTDASTLLLPATTLAKSCYNSMFRDCKALTAAPALPATTLAENCYYQMFNGCSVLTAAPALPATTLATSCYYEMFNGCSALTAAPALPATTLVQTCYDRMFNGCSNLSSVTCLATEGINQNNSTYDWLDGVAATGTFYYASDAANYWPQGVSGAPSGWTAKYHDGSSWVSCITLSELKTMINNGNNVSSYIFKPVGEGGHLGFGIPVGYVAYVSTGDVDESVSGSRILVTSADDAGYTHWSYDVYSLAPTNIDGIKNSYSLNGYANTSAMYSLNSSDLQAAAAAWEYSAAIPSGGATPAYWFMPSYKQWRVMLDVFSGSNDSEKRSAMNSALKLHNDFYWTSTETNNDAYRAHYLGPSGFNPSNKNASRRVRACFAY